MQLLRRYIVAPQYNLEMGGMGANVILMKKGVSLYAPFIAGRLTNDTNKTQKVSIYQTRNGIKITVTAYKSGK
jgi:hypothetical protein